MSPAMALGEKGHGGPVPLRAKIHLVDHETAGGEEFSIAPRVQISPESKHISECAPLLATKFPSQVSLRQILS
jgi:hypothetical protein